MRHSARYPMIGLFVWCGLGAAMARCPSGAHDELSAAVVDAALDRAAAALSTGQTRAAADAFEEALAVVDWADPTWRAIGVDLARRLGAARETLGQPVEARAAYACLLTHAPSHPHAGHAATRIEAIDKASAPADGPLELRDVPATIGDSTMGHAATRSRLLRIGQLQLEVPGFGARPDPSTTLGPSARLRIGPDVQAGPKHPRGVPMASVLPTPAGTPPAPGVHVAGVAQRSSNWRTWTTVGGGIAIAVGVALGIGGWSRWQSSRNSDEPVDHVNALRRQANGLWAASAVSAAAGLTALTVAMWPASTDDSDQSARR